MSRKELPNPPWVTKMKVISISIMSHAFLLLFKHSPLDLHELDYIIEAEISRNGKNM